ncbi:MAG: hypothetical protein SGILL_000846 [Bacillariaceae sp.]
MVQFPKETDSKRIVQVSTYQPKLSAGSRRRRIRLYNVFFLILYVYQIAWVTSTIGEPYRKFLEKADREGFEVMEGSTKQRAQLEHSFKDINDPNRRTKKIGWFDWMDMDIEELAAEKKKDKEKTVLDSLPKNMRVPSKTAPSFTPTLLLGILAVLHALVLLMQHWSVGFKVWINYREMDAEKVEVPESMVELDLEEDEARVAAWKKSPKNVNKEMLDRAIINPPSNLPTHARVTPAKGRDVLVPIEYYPTLGMTFEYHRRRYVYEPDAAHWSKIRCSTKFPLDILERWTGFDSEIQTVSGQIRYGNNTFGVKQPTFSELYKAQLLSPFTVFQLFCVILWMLDDYWQYSFFTLFMILTFEATVVFSRIKSLGALRGMGNPSRSVFVYRQDKWQAIETSELLPGDIMSLTRVKPHFVKDNSANKRKKVKVEDDGGDLIPADLLLLRGSTVVNEASLTGESVPQMKEGLTEIEKDEHLDMKNQQKMSVAYAGTKMLQCKGAKEVEAQTEAPRTLIPGVPNPPDDGCVCFVLRTGFSSAQGKLVRMIEGSQEKVKGHEKETGLLLLLLFFFAVASSSYVLYHGLQSDKRSKYELLLHCVLIVTSVIPPELPMQMALAVNNSLMTLMKLHIFCTEPYRVPIAGKLDACLFDKTGTLTTDELVAVGVCQPPKLKIPKGKEEDDGKFLTPMIQTHDAAAMVLASCHSLVYIEGETTGDPLESAALKSMRWELSKVSGNAVPSPATEKKPAGKPISAGSESNIQEIEVLTRHHFSSKLQRMSCVTKSVSSGKHYAVLKGSPEAVGKQLGTKPGGYDEKAAFLSKEGYRVIGLAFKPLASHADVVSAQESRAICESDMRFAGFIAFTCRVRKDTAAVLTRLKEGGMTVTMVTGDALLTAVHVAKEVKIIEPLGEEAKGDYLATETNDEIKQLIEKKRFGAAAAKKDKKKQKKEFKPILLLEEESGSLCWKSYESGSKVGDFNASEIPSLSKENDLATTGKSLAFALESDKATKTVLGYFKVFARMTPDAKETVIECLHGVDSLCLMCGDGANDVGALKGADVGVALLTGFGDINVDKTDEDEEKKKDDVEQSKEPVTAIMSQDHLNQIRAMPVAMIKMKIRSLGTEPNKYPELVEKEDLVQLYQIKAREQAVKRHDQKNAKDKKNMSASEKKLEAKRAAAERQERLMKRVKELEDQGVKWASFKAMKDILAEETEAQRKKTGNVKGGGIEASAGALASQFEDMETGDLPMVKLGDASIAAPFTSKMPSIKSCVDIVRQGRCTLVSSIQMVSLAHVYLSRIPFLHVTGLLTLAVSFTSLIKASGPPILSTMMTAVHFAKQNLPPDHEVDLDGQFQPGILNTVVFLVSNVQQVTVFVVNLQGRPFMTGLTENRPLLWSLVCTFILTFMFASESVPSLNRYFQLVPFPDETFRDFILKLLVGDVCATFLWDRFMKFLFCPNILFASLKGTTVSDVLGLGRTIGVIFFVMYTFLGNEDTWDELMLQEGRLEELGINGTNITNATDVLDNVTECVGEGCATVLNESLAAAAHDEF